MILAIASGKGGTGKTSVAVALARLWPRPVVLGDADVEAPNVHLFVPHEVAETFPVALEVPVVQPERCHGCGACADLCQFGAIALLSGKAMVFPEMCHACGGCFRVCPHDALACGERLLGEVAVGDAADGCTVVAGRLRVGEVMTPPVERAVVERARKVAHGRDILVDCPPGVSCPAMTAVEQSDRILLVTEPTPFGFHDFCLAHEAFAPLGKPMLVVLNRVGLGTAPVEAYCQDHNLPVVARIPYTDGVARLYARGGCVAEDETVRAALIGAVASLVEANHA